MEGKKRLTIEDLLSALKNSDTDTNSGLQNTKDTWARIGSMDVSLAADLGCKEGELNEYLSGWIEDNPYSSI